MRRRPVADDLSDIRGATAWVVQQVAGADILEDVRFNIEVCVEEALANLIEHGRAATDAKDIAIAVDADPDGATILVTDRCLPFDGAAAPTLDRPTRGDMRPGGQGLRLMRAFASELTYRTIDGRNELTMRFRSPT
ncbi:MAG TPA: ATP-binding protein [Caulobacteraceae bacterium]|nr:ATP-binding protein [Caulobacteraceae bacterium]